MTTGYSSVGGRRRAGSVVAPEPRDGPGGDRQLSLDPGLCLVRALRLVARHLFALGGRHPLIATAAAWCWHLPMS